MSTPKLIFSVIPHNDTHLLIEILGADGTWQIPIEREQASILAQQLSENSKTNNQKEDLVGKFLQKSMIRLPAGRLWMGSMPKDGIPEDELPRHAVQITRPFFLSNTLVAQGLYRECMGDNPSEKKGAKKPVCGLNWYDAIHFCNALSEREGFNSAYTFQDDDVKWDEAANGYRLPTEAEWEYAARTQDDLRFVGSDSFEEVAYCDENSDSLADIASKKPNIWGFFDMSGLVFEWCWDVFAPYNVENAETDISERVCRGGSWKHASHFARTTARYSAKTEHKGAIGIRLARNAS
jgi:sulfatase modifying factor 1